MDVSSLDKYIGYASNGATNGFGGIMANWIRNTNIDNSVEYRNDINSNIIIYKKNQFSRDFVVASKSQNLGNNKINVLTRRYNTLNAAIRCAENHFGCNAG